MPSFMCALLICADWRTSCYRGTQDEEEYESSDCPTADENNGPALRLEGAHSCARHLAGVLGEGGQLRYSTETGRTTSLSLRVIVWGRSRNSD
jgi:hypothetical protein|eukprot:SAG25_NODE_114_length_14860_cov_13.403672_18_plen_93_part_00